MTTDKEYFAHVARLRKLFNDELATSDDLPPFLRPDEQEVTEDIRQRSQELKEVVLRGDSAGLIESLRSASPAGFNRSNEDAQQIPELDEARQETEDRLLKEGNEEHDQAFGGEDNGHRPGDTP